MASCSGFFTAMVRPPSSDVSIAQNWHWSELPRVLRELHATLKPGGVLFSSNPRGQNEEGWNGGRYGTYHDLASWRRFLEAAGFTELEHYYRPPGLPLAQQPWLATVWRKAAG